MESPNLQVVAVLMPLEIKRHTVPHLKYIISGLEPKTSRGGSSNAMAPMIA